MATNIVQNSEFHGVSRSIPARTPESARPAPTGLEFTLDQVRERAYFLYLARGSQPGDPEADWTAAERELRAEADRRAGRTAPDRNPTRSQMVEPRAGTIPEVLAGAGAPSSSGLSARRTPVRFTGG